MSERNAQDDGEQLFDTVEPEVSTDTDLDTEDGEQDHTLDLDGKRSAAAEEQREKQIATWKRRIDSGEKTIKDIPVDAQWLIPHLSQLDKPKVDDLDVDALIDRRLAERDVKNKFTSLKATLEDMPLTPAQRKELQAEYADLRDSGANQAKALEKAIKIVGIKLEQDPGLYDRMKLPPEGSSRRKPKSDDGAYNEIRLGKSEEERVEYLEKVRKGLIKP